MAKAIPAAPAERILKSAGAKRVSDPAKKALADVLEDIGLQIAEQAVKIAKNCGRKTITDEDIKMVRL
tara:strand:+ start:280 stop:483 length:204 start_codon:yes stop_codon:yes gene_type:complete